jgi:hypothetical protein
MRDAEKAGITNDEASAGANWALEGNLERSSELNTWLDKEGAAAEHCIINLFDQHNTPQSDIEESVMELHAELTGDFQ